MHVRLRAGLPACTRAYRLPARRPAHVYPSARQPNRPHHAERQAPMLICHSRQNVHKQAHQPSHPPAICPLGHLTLRLYTLTRSLTHSLTYPPSTDLPTCIQTYQPLNCPSACTDVTLTALTISPARWPTRNLRMCLVHSHVRNGRNGSLSVPLLVLNKGQFHAILCTIAGRLVSFLFSAVTTALAIVTGKFHYRLHWKKPRSEKGTLSGLAKHSSRLKLTFYLQHANFAHPWIECNRQESIILGIILLWAVKLSDAWRHNERRGME